jgi:hypothetical protein
MPISQDLKTLLDSEEGRDTICSNFERYRRLIQEMKERGIICKKVGKVTTRQETEQYGYERFLSKESF